MAAAYLRTQVQCGSRTRVDGTEYSFSAVASPRLSARMQDLSHTENGCLGVCVGTAMTVLIQPLKFWKNAAQTGQLALTFNPHILYVGTTTTWLNEIGQLALQFGFTGVFKRMAARGGDG